MSTQLSMTAPTQLGLFDDTSNAAANKVVFVPYEPPPLYTPGAQAEHLERVTVRIGAAIVAFCRDLLRWPDTYDGASRFQMEDLLRFIAVNVGPVAPDSPGRILRALRQKGRIDYRVISRKDSLYEVVSVHDAKEAA